MWRARVVRVSGGLWVECPAIVPGEVFGPCQRVGAMPAVGDWVLVADVGDPACPELVVVGATATAVDPSPGCRRNLIINGDFSVNQRGFTSTTAASTYGLDRWYQSCSGGTSTYSVQMLAADSITTGIVRQPTTNCRLAVSGQSAASDVAALIQRIEGVRTLAGQSATVSFWAAAASGTPSIGVELVQSFGTGGSPSTRVFVPAGTVPITTGWARYSVTVALPTITGMTLGTDGNDHLGLYLWTAAGSGQPRGQGIGLQNATINFWGVQVEGGEHATPFEQSHGNEELVRCQRYYARLYAIGYTNMATQPYSMPLPACPRATPTVSVSWSAGTGGAFGVLTSTSIYPTANHSTLATGTVTVDCEL